MTGFYMKCKAGLKRDNLILCKAVVVEEALFKNLVVGGNGVHGGGDFPSRKLSFFLKASIFKF